MTLCQLPDYFSNDLRYVQTCICYRVAAVLKCFPGVLTLSASEMHQLFFSVKYCSVRIMQTIFKEVHISWV